MVSPMSERHAPLTGLVRVCFARDRFLGGFLGASA